MSSFEKLYCIFAIIFALGIAAVFAMIPESRSATILLPISFCGLLVNVGLMFVVLKDIFTRNQLAKTQKYIWTGILLVCWPAILVYLSLHGFHKKGQLHEMG